MTRETVTWSTCHSCSGAVAVKKNVSEKAYYSCEHCGFKAQHTWQRSSDAYLAKIAPAPAPAPTATPRATAPAPAPTATPPAATPAPARRSAGTVLG